MDSRYKNSFIHKVIVRVDFNDNIYQEGGTLHEDIIGEITNIFPIAEPVKVTHQRFEVKREEFKHAHKVLEHYHYLNKKRDKILHVTPDSFDIEYLTYESHEVLFADFNSILSPFETSIGINQLSRLGLRYINKIILPEDDPFDWSEYLNENLLSIFSIPKPDELICQALHKLVILYEDFFVNIHYGMNNPDFPTPIIRKSYILDLDAYFSGLLDFQSATNYLTSFHEKINEIFERMIEDPLRQLMRGITDEQR